MIAGPRNCVPSVMSLKKPDMRIGVPNVFHRAKISDGCSRRSPFFFISFSQWTSNAE